MAVARVPLHKECGERREEAESSATACQRSMNRRLAADSLGHMFLADLGRSIEANGPATEST